MEEEDRVEGKSREDRSIEADYEILSDPDKVVKGVMLVEKGSLIDDILVPSDRQKGVIVFWLGELPINHVYLTANGNHLVRTKLTCAMLSGEFELFGLLKRTLRIHIPCAAPNAMWEGDCEGEMLKYLPSDLPLPFPGSTFNDVSLSSPEDDSPRVNGFAAPSTPPPVTRRDSPLPLPYPPPHIPAAPSNAHHNGSVGQQSVQRGGELHYPPLPRPDFHREVINSNATASPPRTRSLSNPGRAVRVTSKEKRISRGRTSSQIGASTFAAPTASTPSPASSAPSSAFSSSTSSSRIGSELTSVVSSFKESMDSAGAFVRELASEFTGDDASRPKPKPK